MMMEFGSNSKLSSYKAKDSEEMIIRQQLHHQHSDAEILSGAEFSSSDSHLMTADSPENNDEDDDNSDIKPLLSNINPDSLQSPTDSLEISDLYYTVEEAIEHIGFGRFQLKVILITGLFQATDALEMLLLSVLSPELRCQFQLEDWQVALITTVVFIGMFVGSHFWGSFADKHGRKPTMLIAAFWIGYFGLLTSQSPHYYWILILRGLVGTGFGGAVQSFTLVCEYLPSKYRAKLLILSNVMWTSGCLFEILMAYLLIPALGWRALVIVSAIPTFITVLCVWTLPESARYLLAAGRRKEAIKVLMTIAKTNNRSLPSGELIPSPVVARGRVKDLFKGQYARTTFQLLVLWFGVASVYYGIILAQSEILEMGGICGQKKSQNEESCRCQHHDQSDYISMIIATVGEIAIIPVNLLTIDYLGRTKSIGLNFFLAGILSFLVQICSSTVILTFLIFGIRAFISGSFNIVYIYTGEVFPTTIRSLGIGSCSAMARVGCMVTPFVAQVLLAYSVRMGLGTYGVLCLLCAVIAYLLPIETLGRPLQQMLNDVKDETLLEPVR